MRRSWVLICLCLYVGLALGWPVHGAEVKGTVDSMIIYSRDLDQWRNQISFDLRYIQGFGYTSKVLVHPLIRWRWEPGIQGLTLEMKEVYYDLYLNSLDLRLGKQLVNWGNSYLMSPLNIVNPLDLGAEDPLQMQLGSWGGTAKYYFDYRTELTGVVVGIFEPTRVPERIRRAKTQEMEDELVTGLVAEGWNPEVARERVAGLETEVDFPIIDQFQELEYGLQLTRRGVGVFDLSLCYYEGYEDLISMQTEVSQLVDELAQGSEATPKLELEFKRARSLGASAVGFIGPAGVWAEGAWYQNEAGRQRIDGVVGSDLTLSNGLYTVVQLHHSRGLNSLQADAEPFTVGSDFESYLVLMNRLPFQRIHRLQSTFLYDWREQGYLISPELKFSLQTDLSLQVGALCKGGQVSSLIESWGESKYYLKLTYGF